MFEDALKPIKSGLEIIRFLKDFSNTKEIQELQQILNDSQQNLMTAQAVYLDLHEKYSASLAKIAQLEKELADMQAFVADANRYVLHRYPTGAVTYLVKPDMQGEEPFHELCTNCFSHGVKSILQPSGVHPKIKKLLCPACGQEILTESPLFKTI